MQTKNNRLAPSREGIRLALKERTGANQVDPEIVDRVGAMLKEELARIVDDVARAYEAEKEVRKFHRRPNPVLGPQHLPQKRRTEKPLPLDPDV